MSIDMVTEDVKAKNGQLLKRSLADVGDRRQQHQPYIEP